MQRPAGAIIIGIVDFLFAAFFACLGLLFFAGGTLIQRFLSSAGTMPGNVGPDVFAKIGAVAGIMILLWAAFCALVGWGMIAVKNWARIISIILAALGVLLSIPGLLNAFRGGPIVMTVIFLAYYVWVIWYLLMPGVAQAFTQRAVSAAVPTN
jgi:hypothetical protein